MPGTTASPHLRRRPLGRRRRPHEIET